MNSLDMHIELLKASRDAVKACEVGMASVYVPEGSKRADWIDSMERLRNAVDRYGEKL